MLYIGYFIIVNGQNTEKISLGNLVGGGGSLCRGGRWGRGHEVQAVSPWPPWWRRLVGGPAPGHRPPPSPRWRG